MRDELLQGGYYQPLQQAVVAFIKATRCKSNTRYRMW